MGKKWVYFFANGQAEGNAQMRDILGGKGANLAEMTNAGVPVPPGFTISAEVCKYYYDNNRTYPEDLKEQVDAAMKRLEEVTGKGFGDPKKPLLVSVRSGAAISMPGMMDTILNLGLNDETVKGLVEMTNNERFAYDSYRRFLQMFGDTALGIPHADFENALAEMKAQKGVKLDTELDAEDLKKLVEIYKEIYKKHGKEFPQDVYKQLWAAIEAVIWSWMSDRAIKYREIHGIKEGQLLGTAVNIVAMVFGNMGDDSGTGVCFTRDPNTGEKVYYGEFLPNAQGEDVVAGIRTPYPLEKMKELIPQAYEELIQIMDRLERYFKDMQDIEFTVERGKLYILQTRSAKRTSQAAIKVAVDMVHEGLIDKKTAVLRVQPSDIERVLHPKFDENERKNAKVIAKGLPASPGAATGKVYFDAHKAEEAAKAGEKVLLVRPETSPEDVGGMNAAEGILTARGGMTSHAAVVARGLGKPAVVGAESIYVNEEEGYLKVGDIIVKEGEWLSIDGTTGEVFLGKITTVKPQGLEGPVAELLSWADEFRKLGVRANADVPRDAKVAREFGAEGIGLCRTEHMFFEKDRIPKVRRMIVARTKEEREAALAELLPLQKEDFKGLFREMKGYPVTIRLIDPPLHEFLPQEEEQMAEVAQQIGISVEELKKVVEQLHELNPMLGHRGVRLVITYPEIAVMQTKAIILAAIELKKEEGIEVVPEIMIPLVGHVNELKYIKQVVVETADALIKEHGVDLKYLVGTMIEVPRAAVTADQIAQEADFFSFGTNDLTQMTFGFSRDDVGKFLPEYLEKGILEHDPFKHIDTQGVGQLVKLATEKGKEVKPTLKCGVCGEHGGDPKSIEFFATTKLDYVSASPYRIPVARLAAAQASIKYRS
ncbi:pyruvate, phosphate dikinase [Fervidobacterium pennivorans subsp. shakshaketiis]|jgi:pyruvate,orthophosphate dikinase|uniref:Pyruvate, phosphate dikinase n=1 Tax=Fervidobacterium pennivorans (strain DSM 9078 / Ven5) TaxID=771875 RepID=H9UBV4_FERPD|nr:pyruvate, phosphate dikinase [Fervidobacterium pennivorans]AFG34997.1 pyruvate phosphate dikinase [Fervidobacterium pennivorans DSM 9078]QIV78111.1 pyruvate, phosphate dikinase [Fervidobacterium pennivorans subsp. keratinolyticus]